MIIYFLNPQILEDYPCLMQLFKLICEKEHKNDLDERPRQYQCVELKWLKNSFRYSHILSFQ